MPYPVAHVMFFVICICAIAIYATLRTLLHKELSSRNAVHILLLLFVGGSGALLPDSMVAYSILVNGTMEHCWIGPIPTHSFLFSSSAILFGIFVGYAAYRDFGKAAYMGIFAEAAFLSHLWLDDIAGNDLNYFYPIYNESICVFSYVNGGSTSVDFLYYLLASYASISFISFVMIMALFSLNHLGFEFSYRSKK